VTPSTLAAVPSQTPFLDREAPLPPRAAPGSGLTPVLAVWLGVIALIAACSLLDWPPVLRRWILTQARPWVLGEWARIGFVGFGLSVIAAFYLMLTIHELGHAVAGLCVGFRLRALRVGPLVFSGLFRVSLYRGPGAVVNGVAELVPVATDKLAWRGAVMVLAGPFANFATAICVLLIPLPMTVFSLCFITFSLVNGLNDLFPYESRLGVSDGSRIWMLLRRRAGGERWLALFHLGGALADGVLPESMSREFLAKAVAVRNDSADTVISHAFAYLAAFHQHKDHEAAQLLETCLRYSAHATPVVREALMSDAAVFQARRRNRPDLADQWLAQIPEKAQIPWFRSRAQAAILEANGDIEGARRKLTDVETELRALPKNPQREAVLNLLERWKSDLVTRELESTRVTES
jgi:hypothetical protein